MLAGLEIRIQFEAALGVLKFWRDSAAHGKAVAISELEAHAGLTQLLEKHGRLK